MADYDNIDIEITKTIDAIRAEHHACTARRVGQLMRVSPDVVRGRLMKMKDEGLVTWTDVPGSLRVVETPLPDEVEPPKKKTAARKKAAAKAA